MEDVCILAEQPADVMVVGEEAANTQTAAKVKVEHEKDSDLEGDFDDEMVKDPDDDGPSSTYLALLQKRKAEVNAIVVMKSPFKVVTSIVTGNVWKCCSNF